MAASEGQVDCLKILLDLKADTRVTDERGQTPLDLARLWGHRACAKLLSANIWHRDKNDANTNEDLVRKLRTQDILKEIEQAHFAHFDTKEESEKKFDIWLVNQGFEASKGSLASEKRSLPAIQPPPKSAQILVLDDSFRQEPNEPKSSKKSIATTVYFPKDSSPETSSRFVSDSDLTLSRKKSKASSKKKEDEIEEIKIHSKPWNYSTKAKENDYITGLNDFFPRDPYTFLPKDLDLVLLNKELKGMSLDEVKQFMKKKLTNNPNGLADLMDKSERPVYYKPRNIIDAQTKIRMPEDAPPSNGTGMSLTHDIKAQPFRQAKKYILKTVKSKESSSHGNYYNTADTLKQIKNQLAESDDKLEIVKRHYGNELSDFMKDKRHGVMSQKYEKVFIC